MFLFWETGVMFAACTMATSRDRCAHASVYHWRAATGNWLSHCLCRAEFTQHESHPSKEPGLQGMCVRECVFHVMCMAFGFVWCVRVRTHVQGIGYLIASEICMDVCMIIISL